MKVLSVGYQGRSLDDLCATLVDAGATVLVDVRERAWSQRPEFRKTALKTALAKHGIRYEHCREAGNPYRPRQGERLSSEDCARRYRKHLDARPEALERVAELVGEGPVALFCYEATTGECHRGVLISVLCERGTVLDVVDL
ncbi:MAG: DUF488 domain-containing protein [Sandaracinaceae bacterium]|nr:DUF488 domain-containing protein [Sandaracinaceae bacterium]